MRKYGFTLIELLVVIAIIGILAVVVSLGAMSVKNSSRYARVISDIDGIKKAAEMYYAENKSWPDNPIPPALPTGLDRYLKSWPQPPCSGYYYMWSKSLDTTVQVNLLDSSNGPVGYVCISGSCSGTSNLATTTDKKITCQ